LFQSSFSSRGGYPWPVEAIVGVPTGRLGSARGLSQDSPCLPRDDLFEVDAHPQNQIKTINEVLNNKIREFVLTWSKQKSVSSTVALGIMIFGKGGLLAPESVSKSTMVIMSCQLLFIDFLVSFCHFFGPLY
jgi:hypothetical protein